jgi:hypothetical protein
LSVVAEQGDPPQAERPQHLRGREVASFVLAVTQSEVGLVRVEPGVLKHVSIELGVEADPTPVLPEIEQEASGGRYPLDGLAQLRATVTPLTAEHVSGEALAVQPDERCARATCACDGGGPVAQPEGEVLLTVDEPVERERSRGCGVSVCEPRWHGYLGTDRGSGQRTRHRRRSVGAKPR